MCKVVIYNYVFMLALFHDKKCCKCIKLFSYILWNFIVLGLVLSWWRIEHEIKISAISQLAREKFMRTVTREKGHVRSTCWKMKSQVPASFRECFVRQAILWGTRITFRLKDFKCDFVTFHPYYINPHYPEK